MSDKSESGLDLNRRGFLKTAGAGLAAAGLMLIDHHPVSDPAIRSVPVGVTLALTAVGCWTWFGLVNQSTLARRPAMDAGVWTALITLGASIGMLCFTPTRAGLIRLAGRPAVPGRVRASR